MLAKIAGSSECRYGHHAPQRSTFSAVSPAPGMLKSGCDAPRSIKLAGNFARRHFPASDRKQVFRDEELSGFGLRVRKAGGNATWFVNVPGRGVLSGKCQRSPPRMRAGRNPTRVRIRLTASRVPHETCFVQTPPLFFRRDPSRGVAVFPLHSEPA